MRTKKKDRTHDVYLPTAREIRKACKEIQASWSDKERLRRRVGPRREPWEPPQYADNILEGVDE